jgi:predicted AAA+ superfamily ATPase
MIGRKIATELAAGTKSLLLLGPRQTGKSTLLARLFPEALTINLADEAEYLDFAGEPRRLTQRLDAASTVRTVFIDEIQRLPSLLNTIQKLIDDRRGLRFILTGSSARKLRRGQANLLPGRLHTYMLGPLVAAELGYRVEERSMLAFGSLPGIYTEDSDKDKMKTLTSYAATYLKEEVQAEALTRNIEGFARFLKFAAVSSSQFLDVQKLASQAQINHQTARRYFEILEDTLITHRLEAFAKSTRTRLIQHPRYFFFDTGVLNGLLGNFIVSDDRKGLLFETLVVTQVIHSIAARDEMGCRLSSYRTEHGAEVDLILERPTETVAIEIKATRNVGEGDLSGLASFARYFGKPHRSIVAYMGDDARRIGDVEILPWQAMLKTCGL